MSYKLTLGDEDIVVKLFLETVGLHGLHISHFLGGMRSEGMEVGLRLLHSLLNGEFLRKGHLAFFNWGYFMDVNTVTHSYFLPERKVGPALQIGK
jgi:hypothetical protein